MFIEIDLDEQQIYNDYPRLYSDRPDEIIGDIETYLNRKIDIYKQFTEDEIISSNINRYYFWLISIKNEIHNIINIQFNPFALVEAKI